MKKIKVTINPARGIDVGAGKGESLESVVYGGVVGLIFDGRNRPITLSKESDKRIESLLNWSKAVDEYPKGRNVLMAHSYTPGLKVLKKTVFKKERILPLKRRCLS